MASPVCAAAFAVTVSYEITDDEHPWDNDPTDPGNWTGGSVGAGENLGTCWGVDTASYPSVLQGLSADVRATMPAHVKDLTKAQAAEIFDSQYFSKVRGDELPPQLAVLVADAVRVFSRGEDDSGLGASQFRWRR